MIDKRSLDFILMDKKELQKGLSEEVSRLLSQNGKERGVGGGE